MIKLNTKQIQQGLYNPKALAKSLVSEQRRLNKGFRAVTLEICYELGKGLYTITDASKELENKLMNKFSNSKRNLARRSDCQIILHEFYDFLEHMNLSCVLNFTRVNIPIGTNRKISGNSCPIFKQKNGRYAGLIIVDDEYDFSDNLRTNLEKHIIAKRMNVSDIKEVDLFLFRLVDCSYELIYVKELEPQQMFKEIRNIFDNVEVEINLLRSVG